MPILRSAATTGPHRAGPSAPNGDGCLPTAPRTRAPQPSTPPSRQSKSRPLGRKRSRNGPKPGSPE